MAATKTQTVTHIYCQQISDQQVHMLYMVSMLMYKRNPGSSVAETALGPDSI